MSKDTVSFMIQKAGSYEKRLIKVISGEPEEEVQQVAVPAKAEIKQEEKEKPKADFAASFF